MNKYEEVFTLRDEELLDWVADQCIDAGMIEEIEVEGVVKWVNSTIVNGVILAMIYGGQIKIVGYDQEHGVVYALSEEFKAEHPEIQTLNGPIWKEIEDILNKKDSDGF